MRDVDVPAAYLALDNLFAEMKSRLGQVGPATGSIDELSAELRLATHYGDPVEVAIAALQLYARGAKVSRMPTAKRDSGEYKALLQAIDVGLEIEAERAARAGRDRRGDPRPGQVDRRRSMRGDDAQRQAALVGAPLQRGDLAGEQ